jgi:hypothetical protein
MVSSTLSHKAKLRAVTTSGYRGAAKNKKLDRAFWYEVNADGRERPISAISKRCAG